MPRTANLSCTVTIAWQDTRGVDRDAEVEVDYTFDGDLQSEPSITSQRVIDGADDLNDWELDELVWEAVNERCMDDYAEWAADEEACRADYLADLRAERELAE